MSFATSAKRAKVVADADNITIKFLDEVDSILTKADAYIAALSTKSTELASAKSAVDAALEADPGNPALTLEQSILAGKVAENAAVVAQAQATRTGLAAVVNG